MGRTHLFTLFTLLLVLGLCESGCNSNSPVGPINPNNRSYGPPHNPVVFNDGDGYLATVSSVSKTTSPAYVRGIGDGETVSDLAYGFHVRPNSTANDASFCVYDGDSGMLYVLDSYGSETATFFDGDLAFEDKFAFSNGGARLVYVSGTSTNQELIIVGVNTDYHVSVTTLDASQTFIGRPAVDIGTSVRIAMMVTEGSSSWIIIYDQYGLVPGLSLETPVQALTYSPNGNHLAWVDASTQHHLVIYDPTLSYEQYRIDFSAYGNGVSALSWSPDGTKIAFFAGSSGTTGRLCVYTLGLETPVEIVFDGTYEFPVGTEKMWAQPAWNSSSSELVFTVLDNEDMYNIAKVDMVGNLTTLYEDVGGTRYVAWMDE